MFLSFIYLTVQKCSFYMIFEILKRFIKNYEKSHNEIFMLNHHHFLSVIIYNFLIACLLIAPYYFNSCWRIL